MTTHVLVMAKAPVAGLVKTRLGASVGMDAAADLAAAALLDTLEACWEAFGEHCHLALDGSLEHAARGAEIRRAVERWDVFVQSGASFGERLAHAHLRLGTDGAVVVQIGMDTPQVTPTLLREVADGVRTPTDAVLGPAEDGGWWVLALADGHRAAVLSDVPMSEPNTRAETGAALARTGLQVRTTETLRDVDTAEDADVVAAIAPSTRFARAWADQTAVRT